MPRRSAFFLDVTIDEAEELDKVRWLEHELHRIPDMVLDLMAKMDQSGSFELVCQNGHGAVRVTQREEQAETLVGHVVDGFQLAPRLNLATRQGNTLIIDLRIPAAG